METEGKLSYVKRVIHSLVVSCPDRMTIERLMCDYRNEEGAIVPYGTLGFRDTESFLRAIPDTVVVVGHGPTASVLAVAKANSAHIQNLVQCQKKPTKSRCRARLKPRFFYASDKSDLCFINEHIRNMNQQQQQQHQQRQQQQQQRQPVHHTPVSYPNYNRLQYPVQTYNPMPPHRPVPVVYPNMNALICAGQQQQVPFYYPPTLTMLTPFPYPYPQNVPIFPKITPLLQRHNLPRPEEFNFRNPQAQSVQARLAQKPEIQTKELVDSFQKLSTANTTPTGFIDPLDNANYVSDREKWVRDDFSSADGELPPPAAKDEKPEQIGAIKRGAMVELELEPVSQGERYPEPLEKSTISNNTVQSWRNNNPFFESSDEEDPNPQDVSKNPFLDYESSDDGSDENAIPLNAVDDRVLSVDYPKDCVRSDFKLPARVAAATFDIGERIEVQLVMVEHPHNFNFWIYNNDYDDYKAMYSNMQVCYDSQYPDKYVMPMCLITTDHMCVVRSKKNGAWERAQVVRHQPGNQSKIVEVQLVDTGEVICVNHKDVMHLLKDFATLPSQCLNGRLAFVTPWKGPGWSAEAVKYFFRLVSFRRLYAKIVDIKDNSAYLVLVDPDAVTPFNKNLNKAFIDSGLVRRCYET